jgi:hypothetical protein
VQLDSRRADYFSLSTKRSQAHAHAVQVGVDTTRGGEHMAMVQTWKEEGERALSRVSSCLLDKLFIEGNFYYYYYYYYRYYYHYCYCY